MNPLDRIQVIFLHTSASCQHHLAANLRGNLCEYITKVTFNPNIHCCILSPTSFGPFSILISVIRVLSRTSGGLWHRADMFFFLKNGQEMLLLIYLLKVGLDVWMIQIQDLFELPFSHISTGLVWGDLTWSSDSHSTYIITAALFNFFSFSSTNEDHDRSSDDLRSQATSAINSINQMSPG